jgi:hypothetical protein
MIWSELPSETDPRYFQSWQRVSLALQKGLRAWIPEAYFGSGVSRYEDRDVAYALVVYEACRVFYGRPRTEFTYDVADPGMLPAALRSIGRTMQTVLGRVQNRLHEAGRPELGRRYAPVWHLDILNAVQKKPRRLIGLLATESAVINALIDWGTIQSVGAEKRFGKAVVSAARIYGPDAGELREKVLSETVRVLDELTNGGEDLVDRGVLENRDAFAARSPEGGVG